MNPIHRTEAETALNLFEQTELTASDFRGQNLTIELQAL